MNNKMNSYYIKLFLYAIIVAVFAFFIYLLSCYKDEILLFIKPYSILIFSIIIFFLIQKLLVCNYKKNRNEENCLLDDNPYKELDKDKVDAVRNIVETYNSDEFFSLALIGAWGSGKSSFLKKLKKDIKKDGKDEVIYLNVWELGKLRNILQEIEKEFDNILFKNSIFHWIEYHIKSIFIKNYFSLLLKYFIKTGNFSFSLLSPTIKDLKDKYNDLLKEVLGNKKIVLMIDEVDRLDSKKEILNVFKIIRYLTSFDKVFTITALDISQIKKNNIDLEYTHKIFNSKYVMPNISKNDLLKFIKIDIKEKLLKFISKEEFKKLLDKEIIGEDKYFVDYFENYRQIKNCFNDICIIYKTLKDKEQNINFEFIFTLSLIKAINFKFYNELMKDQDITGFLIKNLNKYMSDKEEKDNKNLKYIKRLKEIKEKKDYKNVIPLCKILYDGNVVSLERSLYVYTHYKIYDHKITDEKYESFLSGQKKIENEYNGLKENEKILFISSLLDRINIENDTEKQHEILSKIYKIAITDHKYNFLDLIFNNNNIGIIKNGLSYYFEDNPKITNVNTLVKLISGISKISDKKEKQELAKYIYNETELEKNKPEMTLISDIFNFSDEELRNELIKYIYEKFIEEKDKDLFKDYLLQNINEHLHNLFNKKKYFEELKKEIKNLGETIDSFFKDYKSYLINNIENEHTTYPKPYTKKEIIAIFKELGLE